MCNRKTIEISVNIGVNLHDFGFSNGFLDMTSKTQVTTLKVDKLHFIKI